jgi:hypothetical protein
MVRGPSNQLRVTNHAWNICCRQVISSTCHFTNWQKDDTSAVACTTKLFLVVIFLYDNKLECLPLPPLCNICEQGEKPTIRVEFCKGLLSGRLLALPKNIRLGVEVNGIGKPSTKLQYGNNYSRKNLIVQARGERPRAGGCYYKTFYGRNLRIFIIS